MSDTSISDDAVNKATGHDWAWWYAYLDKKDGKELPHKELAKLLRDQTDVSAWWAQMITVEYERHIGRREVGQSCTGNFQTAASKTMPGDMDAGLKHWKRYAKGRQEFNDVPILEGPNETSSEKWGYWRVKLADETKVTVSFNNKTAEKSQIAINHDKLPDKDAVAMWKEYWKGVLKEFAATVGKG